MLSTGLAEETGDRLFVTKLPARSHINEFVWDMDEFIKEKL